MTGLFSVEMLPAQEGDCLWLSWGRGDDVRHALIDGGRAATAATLRRRLRALPSGQRRLELLIISHIDRDHIEGVLSLIDGGLGDVEVVDVWFNGYGHLQQAMETFGAVQGEALSAALRSWRLPWNVAFGGRAVMVPDVGDLPRVALAGGMEITVLSPTRAKLAALGPRWKDEIVKAGLTDTEASPQDQPGWERAGPLDVEDLANSRFLPDAAPPNGSSVAVLAEFNGRRALLAADAHPEVIVASLERLSPDAPVVLDLLKVGHHGSAHNTSDALLKKIRCKLYLVSTNGNYFKHPDASAISRILVRGGARKRLVFNYRCAQTTIWDNPALEDAYDFQSCYPDAGSEGAIKIAI